MRARGLAERTITEQTATVARISRDCATTPITLTTDDLAEWFATRTLSNGSRSTYRTALRAWFDYLILNDIRTDDPTRKLGKLKAARYSPRPMSTDHLRVLLDSGIRTRTRSMILLGAYEGFRVSEIANMRGEYIDRHSQRIYVRGKGGREDWLPMHPVIDLESRRYPSRGLWFPSYELAGQPMRAKSVSATISQAMGRAGIPGTPHALRHWFGTELRRSGVDLRTVQELMRHANMATTALYTQVDDGEKLDALTHLPLVA
jgi:integrase/recombinase XerD